MSSQQSNRFYVMDVEQFIMLVEERPAIWNPASPEYLNKIVKRMSWEDIAQRLYDEFLKLESYEKETIIRNLQRKWKNLRDAFVKDIKIQERENKHGSERRRRKYVYHDLMVFLFPTLESRNLIIPIDTYEENSEMDDGTNVSLQTSKSEQQTTSASDAKAAKRKKWSEIETIELEFLDNMNKKLKSQSIEADSDDSDKFFLLSLIADFKKIPNDSKINAKTEIMHVIQKWQQESFFTQIKSETTVITDE